MTLRHLYALTFISYCGYWKWDNVNLNLLISVYTSLAIIITFDLEVSGQSTVQGWGDSTDYWKRLDILQTEVEVAKEKAASAENKALELILEVENLKVNPGGQSVKSSTYVRWGRTTCVGNGTILVYKGFTAGSYYKISGSGANYVCLSENPTWEYDSVSDSSTAYTTIYGTEYSVPADWTLKPDNVSPGKLQNQDAPCAVCETVGRGAALMIPGTHLCPQGWTQEYTGYLMSSKFTHKRTEYVCVDGSPEGIAGGGLRDDNGSLLYYVRTKRGALPCYPYIDERETTCVVCSK